MRSLAPALFALLLALPGALATEADPVSVEAEFEPVPSCTFALGNLCVASYDEGGSEGIGDNEVALHPWIAALRASVTAAGQPQEFVLVPEDVEVHHPITALVEASWGHAGQAEPEPLRSLLTFQVHSEGSGPTGLIVHLPVPVQDPIDGYTYEALGVPVTTESRYYFAAYGNWDDAHHDGTVRPLPGGLKAVDSTDRMVTEAAGAGRCGPDGLQAPEWPTGPACPVLEDPAGLRSAAVAAWASATPEVRYEAAVEQVGVALGAAAEASASLATGPTTDRASPSGVAAPLGRGELDEASTAGAPEARLLDAPAAPAADVGPGNAASPPAAQASGLEVLPEGRAGVLAAAAGLGALAAFALYHRICKQRALDQETRRRIHDAIAAQPGIRVGTLQAQLGLNYNTVLRHVRLLEHCGLVEGQGEGQRRLFVKGAGLGVHAKQAAVASSAPVAQAIVSYLQGKGDVEVPRLRADLGLPRSSASTALTRLAGAGLVVARRDGRRLIVALAAQGPGPLAPMAAGSPASAPATARAMLASPPLA
jgi:DNA-binding transcriptional ArsR family regulator